MTLREFLPVFNGQLPIKTFHLASGRMIPVGTEDRINFNETETAVAVVSSIGFVTTFSLSSIESIVAKAPEQR